MPRLTSLEESLAFTFLAQKKRLYYLAGPGPTPMPPMDWLARQRHHSPVQRCRNIDHDTTLELGADSTRQRGDRTGGSSMFHLDQPLGMTHEANR
jgi:hypothetical protein